MTVERARVIKNAFPGDPARTRAELARRIPREIIASRDEAERILAEARAEAARIVGDAAKKAADEARKEETAKLAAGFLALRAQEDARASRDLDRAIELAVLLAERLVGEGLTIDPSRIAALAASALEEARGSRKVRIDAAPDDVAALQAALGAIGHTASVEADPTLARGSLIVHTDLGRIDARLQPQLERLAKALKEALR